MDLLVALSIEELQQLEAAFGSGDGLAIGDFIAAITAALRTKGVAERTRWSPAALHAFFSEIDYDSNGKVSWSELTDFAITSARRVGADVDPGGRVGGGPKASGLLEDERNLRPRTLTGLSISPDPNSPPRFPDHCARLRRILTLNDTNKLIVASKGRTTINDPQHDLHPSVGYIETVGDILAAAYQPFCSILVTATDKGIVQVFDAGNSMAPSQWFSHPSPIGKFAAAAPASTTPLLIAGDFSGSIIGIDTALMNPLTKGRSAVGRQQNSLLFVAKFHLPGAHAAAISGLHFLRSRHAPPSIFSTSLANTLHFHDVETQRLLFSLKSPHASTIRGTVVCPATSICVTFSAEPRPGILHVDHQHQQPSYLVDETVPHTACIAAATLMNSGEVVTADEAGMLKVWDLRMMRCVQTTYTQHSLGLSEGAHGADASGGVASFPGKLVSDLVYVPSREHLYAIGPLTDRLVRHKDAPPPTTHTEPIVAIAFNRHTQSVITATEHELALWSIRSGVRSATYFGTVAKETRGGRISCLTIDDAQSGRRVLIGTSNGFVLSLLPLSGYIKYCFRVVTHAASKATGGSARQAVVFAECGTSGNVIVGLGSGCVMAFRENFLSEPPRYIYVPSCLAVMYAGVGGADGAGGDASGSAGSSGSGSDDDGVQSAAAALRRTARERRKKSRLDLAASINAAMLAPAPAAPQETMAPPLGPSTVDGSEGAGISCCALSRKCGLIVFYSTVESKLLLLCIPRRNIHWCNRDKQATPQTTATAIAFVREDPPAIDAREAGGLTLFAVGDALGCANIWSTRAHDTGNKATTCWLTTVHTQRALGINALACTQERFLTAGTESQLVVTWDLQEVVQAALLFPRADDATASTMIESFRAAVDDERDALAAQLQPDATATDGGDLGAEVAVPQPSPVERQQPQDKDQLVPSASAAVFGRGFAALRAAGRVNKLANLGGLTNDTLGEVNGKWCETTSAANSAASGATGRRHKRHAAALKARIGLVQAGLRDASLLAFALEGGSGPSAAAAVRERAGKESSAPPVPIRVRRGCFTFETAGSGGALGGPSGRIGDGPAPSAMPVGIVAAVAETGFLLLAPAGINPSVAICTADGESAGTLSAMRVEDAGVAEAIAQEDFLAASLSGKGAASLSSAHSALAPHSAEQSSQQKLQQAAASVGNGRLGPYRYLDILTRRGAPGGVQPTQPSSPASPASRAGTGPRKIGVPLGRIGASSPAAAAAAAASPTDPPRGPPRIANLSMDNLRPRRAGGDESGVSAAGAEGEAEARNGAPQRGAGPRRAKQSAASAEGDAQLPPLLLGLMRSEEGLERERARVEGLIRAREQVAQPPAGAPRGLTDDRRSDATRGSTTLRQPFAKVLSSFRGSMRLLGATRREAAEQPDAKRESGSSSFATSRFDDDGGRGSISHSVSIVFGGIDRDDDVADATLREAAAAPRARGLGPRVPRLLVGGGLLPSTAHSAPPTASAVALPILPHTARMDPQPPPPPPLAGVRRDIHKLLSPRLPPEARVLRPEGSSKGQTGAQTSEISLRQRVAKGNVATNSM